MRRRVAVTGMGVVSPVGSSVEEFTASILAGVSGIGPITLFDASAFPTRLAAQVRWNGPILRDRKVTFAVEAARQALQQCGRPVGQGRASLGIGLEVFSLDDYFASRLPGATAPEGLPERMCHLQTPSDLCVHLLSHEHGLALAPLVHVSACAAGTDAIGTAFRHVAEGRCDWALAGGTDSMINPLGLGGFCRIRATTLANEDGPRASRPFDRRRDGFVMGEGAGILVLEPLDAARARGAAVLAEIAGYGSSFDAHGISEPHPEGRGAWQAMTRALEDAGLGPDDVDGVNAHGTSTPKNDVVETLALKRLLGARAARVPVSATKSMIGHLISAAGAVEAIAAIACLRAGQVHPTLHLDEPDPACDLDYVPHHARAVDARWMLSNSFGFGGQNACIVIGRGDEGR